LLSVEATKVNLIVAVGGAGVQTVLKNCCLGVADGYILLYYESSGFLILMRVAGLLVS
jgi:hypothetical protein